jgi:amidase
MQIVQDSWQAKAAAKVAETQSKIPGDWTLDESDLNKAKKQKKLNGPFFEGFLDGNEREIIRNDSIGLVEKIKSRHYSALQVTRAYCKAAAIAHQIVSAGDQSLFRSHSPPLLEGNL